MRGFAFVSKAPHIQAPTILAFTPISCHAGCWDRGLCSGASFALLAPPGSDASPLVGERNGRRRPQRLP